MATATDRKRKLATSEGHFSSVAKAVAASSAAGLVRKHARDLPWRQSRDPYRVWISEIMLQQTQVATVRDYFTRFMEAFPTVTNSRPPTRPMCYALWEGLGYYRRARQLHAAAKQLSPNTAANFRSEPANCRPSRDSVATRPAQSRRSRSTSGRRFSKRTRFGCSVGLSLIAAIRIRRRANACSGKSPKKSCRRRTWPSSTRPSWSWARCVCTPDATEVRRVPAGNSVCRRQPRRIAAGHPGRRSGPVFTELREAAIVVRKNGSVLMRRCGARERWAGLWDFPRFELEASGPLFAEHEIAAKVAAQTGINCDPGSLLKTLKHGVTRYRITLDCYEATFVSGRAVGQNGEVNIRWVRKTELAELPLSTTGRKIANSVERCLTTDISDDHG